MKLNIELYDEYDGIKEYDITLESKWLFKMLKRTYFSDVIVMDEVEYEAEEHLVNVANWTMRNFVSELNEWLLGCGVFKTNKLTLNFYISE